jgi:hypothetical protein
MIESGDPDERLNHTISLQEDGCMSGVGDLTLFPRAKTLGQAGE